MEIAAVEIVVTCGTCQTKQPPLVMPHFVLKRWVRGMKIQDANPNLTPSEAELLISGTCGPCFDKMFKDQ
jgi:hypothetical protein